MIKFGDINTALSEFGKVIQTHPKLTGIMAIKNHDGDFWYVRYFDVNRSTFKRDWQDW